MALAMQFGQTVTVQSPTSLIVRNHTTGQVIDLSGATLSGNGTSSVTWDLHGVTLPDGRYTAELPAADVLDNNGLPLGSTHAVEFMKRLGDINGDGAVNFSDYGLVGANFDPLPGAAFRAGDANGDGQVNFGDYGVIGAHFAPVPLEATQLDFGDALETGAKFPTTLANDGARHILGGTTYLGTGVDAESNGAPSTHADGDGDDDGVIWGSLTLGGLNSIDVTVASVGTVYLNAWIDVNADGDWDDAGEHVLDDVLADNGLNSLLIDIPSGATAGNAFARVRVTDTAGYGYRGLAPTGEVEDYEVSLSPAPSGAFSDAFPGAADVDFGDLDKNHDPWADFDLG